MRRSCCLDRREKERCWVEMCANYKYMAEVKEGKSLKVSPVSCVRKLQIGEVWNPTLELAPILSALKSFQRTGARSCRVPH